MSTEGAPRPVWYVLVGRKVMPATMEEAAASWGTPEGFEKNRRVALTEVYDRRVSTVFLGLDHAFGSEAGPPLFFETMVFRPIPAAERTEWDREHGITETAVDGWTRRYSTYDEAEAGHEETVGLLRLKRGLVEVPTAFGRAAEDEGGEG